MKAVLISLVGLYSFGATYAFGQSDGDATAKIQSNLRAMKATLKSATERLAEARNAKDLLQLNCVNEKLGAIRGLVTIAEDASKSHSEAAGRGDKELTKHELSKILLAGKRVTELRLEVEGCVGEMSRYTGNTDVVVATDNEVRSDEPTSATYEPAFDALNSDRPPPVTGSE